MLELGQGTAGSLVSMQVLDKCFRVLGMHLSSL